MKTAKNILGTIALPLLAFVLTTVICTANGVSLFSTSGHVLTFTRAIANVTLVTFALSINLNSGRFDFSIGSVALLSSVISSTICIRLGLGAGVMLPLSLILGAIFGCISGLIYVIVKLPPIIVSLAVALLYEGIAFTFTGGYGVSFVNNKALTGFSSVPNYILVTVIVLIVLVILFDHTTFGYNYKALMGGQKVSVNSGIKEIRNVLICYSVSGALMGIQGFIASTNNGTIQMALNFGSIGVMFSAFLPMFIGGFIGRFSNDKLGYFLGAVSMAFVSLLFVRLDVDSSIQQIVSAGLLVLFLIYLNNQGRLVELQMLKKLINKKQKS